MNIDDKRCPVCGKEYNRHDLHNDLEECFWISQIELSANKLRGGKK